MKQKLAEFKEKYPDLTHKERYVRRSIVHTPQPLIFMNLSIIL